MRKFSIDGAVNLVPEEYKKYVQWLKPAVEPAFNVIRALIPYFVMIGSFLKDLWEKAQPYHVSIQFFFQLLTRIFSNVACL